MRARFSSKPIFFSCEGHGPTTPPPALLPQPWRSASRTWSRSSTRSGWTRSSTAAPPPALRFGSSLSRRCARRTLRRSADSGRTSASGARTWCGGSRSRSRRGSRPSRAYSWAKCRARCTRRVASPVAACPSAAIALLPLVLCCRLSLPRRLATAALATGSLDCCPRRRRRLAARPHRRRLTRCPPRRRLPPGDGAFDPREGAEQARGVVVRAGAVPHCSAVPLRVHVLPQPPLQHLRRRRDT